MIAIWALLLSSPGWAAQEPPRGAVSATNGGVVRLDMAGPHTLQRGDTVDLLYHAGLLPILLGRFTIDAASAYVLELRPRSAPQVPPEKGMSVSVEIVGTPPLFPTGTIGRVVAVLDNEIILGIDNGATPIVRDVVRVSSNSFLTPDREVGTWEVTKTDGRNVHARKIQTTSEPKIGAAARFFRPDFRANPSPNSDPDVLFETGLAFYEGRNGRPPDYTQAFDRFTKAAEAGHGRAMVYLGVMNGTGQGMPIDATKAFRWYAKAAELGLAEAYYNLGVFHAQGKGVEKNEALAVALFRKAADGGNLQAMYNLGICHIKGIGVGKNAAQAVQWFRIAADKDFPAAQYRMGWVYDKGIGVPADPLIAIDWYRRAAANGDTSARNRLQQMQRGGK